MNNFCSDNFFLKSIFAPLFGLKSPKMLCAPQNINFPISGPILMIWDLFFLLTETNNFSSKCMQLLRISTSLLSFMRHVWLFFARLYIVVIFLIKWSSKCLIIYFTQSWLALDQSLSDICYFVTLGSIDDSFSIHYRIMRLIF